MTDVIVSAFAEALRDRYVLERELGRGGMAAVYLARDLKHDRSVALKVLHPELATSVGPERFQREIRLAARLQHPHILPVHDSGEAAGLLWYTMPFVDGESLRDRLRRERQLSISDALQITREVADALGYAHSQGIVHRDIKPENILMSHGHALVADFGVARALVSPGTQGLTEVGVSVGTPAYMSPEQSLADPVVDGRSDLYSLGCVLYEMLAGEAPYTGTSAQAIVAKRLREPIPHIRTVRETVPLSVDRALERVLAKTAADRYPSATSFVADLGGEPTSVATRAGSTVPGSSSTWHSLLLPLGVVLAVIIAILSRRPAPSEGGSPVLAVLPFENQGRAEDDYFADGLADEVRSKLTQVPGVQVIGRTSSGQYKRSTKPPRQIARELGVRYLLTGTVRWDKPATGPSRVRVDPELVEVRANGEPTARWEAPFEAPLTDVFQVQADIAERVADALNLALNAATRDHLGRPPTTNVEAYQSYLKGLGDPADGDLAGHSVAQLRRDTAALGEAVRQDPRFALAWAQLARARLYLANNEETFNRVEDAFAPAKEATARALALDSTLPAVRLAATLLAAHTNDTVAFFRHRRAGLTVAPNDPDLLATPSMGEWNVHWPAAQQDSVLAALAHAEMLDPRSSRIAYKRFETLLDASRYAALPALAERFAALAPTSMAAIRARLQARLLTGDSAGASALARQMPAGVDFIEYRQTLLSTGSWLLTQDELRSLIRASVIEAGDTLGYHFAVLRIAHELRDTALVRDHADAVWARLVPLLRAHPKDPGLLAASAFAAALGGRLGEARTTIETLRTLVDRQPAQGNWEPLLGNLYRFAGMRDSAIAVTAHAISDRSIGEDGVFVLYDPDWQEVRDDPRFQASLRELRRLGQQL